MEKVTLLSSTGAYVVFDSKGGEFIKETGLPANYETYDGSGVTVPGAFYLLGFDGSNARINPYTTEGYQQHGTTLQTVFLGERTITLKVLVAAGVSGYFPNTAKFFYDIRKQIFDLANPLNGSVTLTYENNYGTKKISALLTQMPSEKENYGTGRVYDITLTANEPFWTDVEQQSLLLQMSTGGAKFPFVFKTPDVHFGTLETSKVLTYEGQAPAGVTILITATGSCVNPKLTCVNSDGTNFVGINKTLTTGQTFKITTHYGDKKVYYNGQNAMRYLLSGSTFFSLQPGDNTLTMTSDSGTATIEVDYYNNYVNP